MVVLAALALALAVLTGCTGDDTRSGGGLKGGGFDEATPGQPAQASDEAVTVTFTRFDGTVGSFTDYAGKPLIINFFASWCAPCVKELPDLQAAHTQLGDQVAFVGVDVGDQLEDGKRLAERAGVTYDLVRDPRQEILRAFGGVSMPTTAFVSREGKVIKSLSKTFTTESLLEEAKAIL